MIAPPPPNAIVTVTNLTVRYGRFVALDHLSVQIPGGCVGLLGPNGAGKTTLIKTLLGFIKPTEGEAYLLGNNVASEGAKLRQKIGLMPEQDCHIPQMNAVEFVAFAGELAGMPHSHAIRRAHEVIEYTGLGEARYRKIETFSTGMKQRVKLAQALVHGPKVLLLDEPTNGLDPSGREDMLNLIRKISRSNLVNVIVSSHLLKDIERTCDSVVVVMKGKLVMSGPIKELTRIQGHPIDVELRDPSDQWVKEVRQRGAQVLFHEGHRYRIQKDVPTELLSRLAFEAAVASQAEVRGIVVATKTLEEAFLEAVSAPGGAS